MEEEEDIKKIIDNNVNYDEFSINELINELKILKKKISFLENLLKKKKLEKNRASNLFKK
tara:strand:+ start:17024 stop:17203 length:180 start_codon:yes stop_codon:yes gene_type:complete